MRRGRAFSGCTDCSVRCYNCDKVVDKDDILNHDGQGYCDDCYSENFSTCDECGDVVHNEDAYYSDLTHQLYCDHCYSNNFRRCEDCDTEIERSDAIERDGDYYCEDCAPDEPDQPIPEEFLEKTEKFKSFSFSKKDRVLEHLYKILPIDIKSLKANHPQIAAALQDLIVFSRGKLLTKELVDEYRASLSPETYPVAYSTWSSKLQRSISSLSQPPVTTSQLVMNILASSELLDKINSNEALRMIFTKTNELSKKSGHPMVENQIGWARLELDPDGYFILVDEIQSDHSNVLSKL
ncbi:hypothetical protein EBS02_12295, partial [bacterium]|nr:hypothetical protein [bacterium]